MSSDTPGMGLMRGGEGGPATRTPENRLSRSVAGGCRPVRIGEVVATGTCER